MFKHATTSEPVDINAPIDAVWDILMDVDRYREWNPFARTYTKTDVRVGAFVDFDVKLGRYDRKQTERFEAIERPTRLAWSTKIGHEFLLTALREQRLEKRSETSCAYFNTDTLEGPLAPVARLLFGNAMHRGFATVGRALKQTAEERATRRRPNRQPTWLVRPSPGP